MKAELKGTLRSSKRGAKKSETGLAGGCGVLQADLCLSKEIKCVGFILTSLGARLSIFLLFPESEVLGRVVLVGHQTVSKVLVQVLQESRGQWGK